MVIKHPAISERDLNAVALARTLATWAIKFDALCLAQSRHTGEIRARSLFKLCGLAGGYPCRKTFGRACFAFNNMRRLDAVFPSYELRVQVNKPHHLPRLNSDRSAR